MDNGKVERVLGIYNKLMGGGLVNKAEEAVNYGVNERTIQRDIDDIRAYMDNDMNRAGIANKVIYDKARKGFRIEKKYLTKLTNGEILGICKILLDSRAFTKEDMNKILDKLIACCVPKDNQKLVDDLIGNEEFHYVEPRHGKNFIDDLWTIGQAVRNCHYIEIDYERTWDKKVVTRKVKPVAIMFSEYYFYVTAFIDNEKVRENFTVHNDSSPTIYRIDRIRRLRVLDESFRIPYSSRFEEGEFRKRVQFMYGGELRKVRFKYTGVDAEAVLDRLPTAVIESTRNGEKKNEKIYVIRAEVFGDGIDMWLRSQGERVKVIE